MVFRDGRLSGRDTIISYDGTYTVDGDFFSATISTRRHTAGHESLLGSDEVELALTGFSKGKFARCSGPVVGVPEMVVEITLIPVRPEEARPPIIYTAADFHLERLPEIKAR